MDGIDQTHPKEQTHGGAVPAGQAEMNRSTRGQWGMFASHRQEIEKLIVRELHPSGSALGRLCVLGAGNCNDLDLTWLTQVFREVHLVDIDTAALERAVRRQRVEGSPKIRLHAPIDLTGMAGLLDAWKLKSPSDADVSAAARRVRETPAADLGCCFDAVLSPCVLSQLIMPVKDAVGADHPRFPQLRGALCGRHLRLMTDLVAPGGAGLLIIDLVSSESFPDLPRVPRGELPGLMRKLIDRRTFFKGLDPASLADLLRKDSRVGEIEVSDPWAWHLGFFRTFLVYGLCFRKPMRAHSGVNRAPHPITFSPNKPAHP